MGRSSEGVDEEAAAELGLEPGALGGHEETGVADGEELLDLGRVEMDGGGEGARAHPALELGDAAEAADEVDVLVAARVGDAEDGAEDLILADRAVEGGDGIGGVVGAG